MQLRDLQDEKPWRVMDGRLFNSPVWAELLQFGTSHGWTGPGSSEWESLGSQLEGKETASVFITLPVPWERSWESGKRLKQGWKIGIIEETDFLGILHCLGRRGIRTNAHGRIYCFGLSSCSPVPGTPSALPHGSPSLQHLHNPFYPTFIVKTQWPFIAWKGLIRKWNHWNPMGSATGNDVYPNRIVTLD